MTISRISTLIGVPFLAAGLASCNDLVVVCPNSGPRWEVSPSELSLAVGQTGQVSVTEITCAGQRRVEVYPEMSVADTVVATAHPYYRHVRGRALGSTTLRLVADGMYEFDATIPVTVR